MAKESIKTKIIFFLAENKTATPTEISEKTGMNLGSINVNLFYLKNKQHYVTSDEKGVYSLTSEGKKNIDEIKKQIAEEKSDKKVEENVKASIPELDDMKAILHWKQIYGRKKMVEKLDLIKKIIE